MSKHDDFQVLEIVRPKTQSSKLQKPLKHHVTEREEHAPSSVARQPPYSTLQPVGSWTNLDLCTLQGHPSRIDSRNLKQHLRSRACRQAVLQGTARETFRMVRPR